MTKKKELPELKYGGRELCSVEMLSGLEIFEAFEKLKEFEL